MQTVAFDARDACAPRLRGWGRYARELLRALRARAAADALSYRAFEHGGRGPELWWEQVTLPRALRRERAQLVHSPNCFLPLRRPCPGVVSVLDLAFELFGDDFSAPTRLKYRTLTPRAARSAERVIAISQFTRADLIERYGVEPSKIRVVPLAPALPLGSAESPDGAYVLAVGDLRRKKNLGRLVQAYAELRAEGLGHRLVLAGADAGEGPALRRAAAGAPVELLGYVGDERLDALIRGADLLVHPSLYEGFGLVLVEAMARGCPVAASRATALPETAGDAAAYFDPLDVADIARAIRSVLEDPARRSELVRLGRARAAELSWERTAAATAAVYQELLA
ncbi:MAG TPA: glycosyltransferase family 1 protein [Solirubrobacteraceae bacterium]|nr:glycosyltransferase family 1 protein [Solirubrobacteraceae bacterium]